MVLFVSPAVLAAAACSTFDLPTRGVRSAPVRSLHPRATSSRARHASVFGSTARVTEVASGGVTAAAGEDGITPISLEGPVVNGSLPFSTIPLFIAAGSHNIVYPPQQIPDWETCVQGAPVRSLHPRATGNRARRASAFGSTARVTEVTSGGVAAAAVADGVKPIAIYGPVVDWAFQTRTVAVESRSSHARHLVFGGAATHVT